MKNVGSHHGGQIDQYQLQLFSYPGMFYQEEKLLDKCFSPFCHQQQISHSLILVANLFLSG